MADLELILQEFIELYHQLDRISKYQGADPIFKITTRGSQALVELSIPASQREFKEFIDNLYILIYEGSSDGKRIPSMLDEKRMLLKIKLLRNHYFHDQELGTPSEIRRKHRQIGDIFQELIGTRAPFKPEHWSYLAAEIISNVNRFLTLTIEKYPDLNSYYEPSEEKIQRFFESNITVFPDKKENFRSIDKKNEFHHLADAPIFIPHFSWSASPLFGPVNAAIHFSSKAYIADLKKYETFLKHIEKLWLNRLPYIARDTRRLFSWSISTHGKLKYGSGIENLLKAIKETEIGIITIFLIGTYGEDYSKTFFIIINNYWKGNFFRDNYLDLYLSNMPLDFKWVEQINESVKILSSNSEPAESYSLKIYAHHCWRSEKRYDIKDKIIGGLGRDGYEDDRDWDQFSGLIISNPFSEDEFVFDEESSFNVITELKKCPVNVFDEIVMSVTNHPPSVLEIRSGKFYGFVRPSIHHLIFDGYGHTIHALLYWGWSLFHNDKNSSITINLPIAGKR